MIGPRTLLPTRVEALGVHVFNDMREGLRDCDVVVMLRLQNERMKGALLPSAGEYFKHYGLTTEKLALRQARRDRHASGPDEPRRRDRFAGRRRRALGDPAAGDVRHRRAHGGDEHPRGELRQAIAASERHRTHEDRDPQRPRHRSRAGGRSRRRRSTSPTARSPPSATRRRVGAPIACIDAARPASSRRASSTSSARLREPGLEYKATLESEMAAAVAGGVTSLACPPDTDPPLDEPGLVEMLKHRARLDQPGARLSGRRADASGSRGDDAHRDGRARRGRLRRVLAGRRAARRHADAAARDAVRGDVRPSRLAAAAGSVPRRAAASRTTAKSRRASACRPFPSTAETIALATIFALVRETRVAVHLCRLSSAGRRRDGARREARGPAGHLRRRRPSPAPVRRRHRLVRSAGAPGAAAARRRAIAMRCARASPTARSTRSAPTTRRSTTTASRCRSARRSRARPASNCCCR